MKKLLSLVLVLAMVLSVASISLADETAEVPSYTYHMSDVALGNNWNPHTWEVNSDDTMLGYVESPLATMTIANSEDGIYQWIFVMASGVEDVTAEHQDDLVKYDVTLPAGKTVEETTEGFVYEIKLRENAAWQDGTPINADTYIYSMQQLLDPAMKNYRANLYYAGESAVAGGAKYYYSNDAGMYNTVASQGFETLAAAAEAGVKVYVDCWNFWGAQGYVDAEGNEVPQYVAIDDETVYDTAEAWGATPVDAFSGASLAADYGAYLEIGAGYDDYVVSWVDNEYMGATYDAVGCYKVDDYTIRYVCQTYLNRDYFLTSLTSNWIVYEPYYEAGKDTTGALVTTKYNTCVEDTMSCGPYMLVSLEKDKQAIWEKNPNWVGFEVQEDGSILGMSSFLDYEVDGEDVETYQTTRIVWDVMDPTASKQAFLKGELSTWAPDANELPTYATSDQLYKVDETYTESFFFCCGLDYLKEMDNSKGNTNSVVLSNVKFRKAMSLAIDRTEYVTATEGWKPAYGMLNSLYYYDAYANPNSIYRNTDAAMQAICNVYGVEYGEGTPYATLKDAYKSITGYNLTEAKNLMKEACDELVAAGLYTAGDPIHVRIGWAKGALTSSDNKQCELLNKFVNAALEGSGFGAIEFEQIGNIPDRYGDVAKGEYAIGYGAWGGAAFYPFRNFQVYCDPDQYSIHEAGSWDPKTETATFKVNGEDMTKTWQEWSQCMVGSGDLSEESFETKLEVLAQMEENYMKFYYRIPLAGTTVCEMLSYQLYYYTEDYNIMYGFGGMELMGYNYNDAEWAEYIASEGGTLSYE